MNAFDYERIKKLWTVYKNRMRPILEDMKRKKKRKRKRNNEEDIGKTRGQSR